jgi:hypothetical protein
MGWSLLSNALQPFKIYCASHLFITSQLVLFLWQTVEIGSLGHVKVVETLQNFIRDSVRDSQLHSRYSIVSLPLRHLLHKGFISFPISYRRPFRPRCPVSRPIKTDSCCLLVFSRLVNLPCWGPSMRALESLPDFQHSMCFLSIQSPIAGLSTLYGKPSTGSGPVNGESAPCLAS